jgi:hypothetical protein
MPSTSKKQHNFMEAIAHSPSFAKKVGVPQSVGKDFSNADKNRKFSKGGDTMATKGVNPFAKFEASAKDKAMDKKEMMGTKKYAKGGSVMSAKMGSVPTGSGINGVASKGKTKGTMIKMGGSKGQNGLPTKMSRGGMAC